MPQRIHHRAISAANQNTFHEFMDPSDEEIRFERARGVIWTVICEMFATAEAILDVYPVAVNANIDNRIRSLTAQRVDAEEMSLNRRYRNNSGKDVSISILLGATGPDLHPVLTCIIGEGQASSFEFPYEARENRSAYEDFRKQLIPALRNLR